VAGVRHDVTTTECDYVAAASSKLAAANIDGNKMSGEKSEKKLNYAKIVVYPSVIDRKKNFIDAVRWGL